ncbi:MAG TPA: asparagine synthase-related protein [Candidatus Limnocylindrales bacterium]|nr:asparagine synthase-related protein [Candidatus Limnocylindrales bacterium]
MSGIVGIFNREGSAVDRALLQALTRFLSFRGPDSCDSWWDGPVGLGHTLLRTTRDCPAERQPAALDGRFSITADARLDSRLELMRELALSGRAAAEPVSDAELILHAYAAWGEDCVTRLCGDFAFAIWDARQKTLFCARDHFGIRPFYFAGIGPLFLFSNTLNCLRAHPEISGELNEAAVADFLLFGLNCDNSATTFRDIRRLPPAHTLKVAPGEIRLKRYWSAPTDGRIRYRREDDYIEHFQMLLQAAVADRMRTDRVGILLSGGLDSSAVAAMAREVSGAARCPTELRAFTSVYESLEGEGDRVHAAQMAEFLNISHRMKPLDSLQPFDSKNDASLHCPEPVEDPFFAGLPEEIRLIAAECRVALSGEGNDNLMDFEVWPYWKDLLKHGDWGAASAIAFQYAQLKSPIGPAVRRRFMRFFAKEENPPAIPNWIAADFARRVDLAARWRQGNKISVPEGGLHPICPKGHASLDVPHWTRFFELENAGVTRQPVEIGYPFLDLRVVNFLLAIPPFPWFFQKFLLREAMVGRMPETVRRRPKTPLAVDPLFQHLAAYDNQQVESPEWTEELNQFVDRRLLPPFRGESNPEGLRSLLRPHCLNFWLQTARGVRYNFYAEARHG